MLSRLAVFLCLFVLQLPTKVAAQTFNRSELRLLHELKHEPNELARYQYLIDETPKLSSGDQILAAQFLSFTQDELGIYNQAVFSFPLKNRLPADLVLPKITDWKAVNAIDAITKLAEHRRIVLINEAHHDAHTRELTLALLPRLKALGFTYFAAEALSDDDPSLTHRGYPISTSGTEYLQEPLYGDIIRTAIKLGFVIVPYDNEYTGQARENAQAETLYEKVFAKNRHARLFVHAGYAHIDKEIGRLGSLHPMAMRLQSLTGIDPLSIDQTEFLESNMDSKDAYHRLIGAFPSKAPEILINRNSGKPWSDRPTLYDINVILPIALNMQAFGGDNSMDDAITVRHVTGIPQVSSGDRMYRPAWLSLNGTRHPFPITTALCRSIIPCVVEANYIDEPDDAAAADRYAFMHPSETTNLYLRPGIYRLRAWDINGKTLSKHSITVAQP